jgi:sec-independent protein translocase protein TatC
VVSSEWLGSHRRHALVVILLVSAIITPPDVMSQFLLGIPVMALYEVGIWIARRVEKGREAEFGEA